MENIFKISPMKYMESVSCIMRYVIFLPNQSRNQSLKYKARIKDQPIYQLLSLINLQTSHLQQSRCNEI